MPAPNPSPYTPATDFSEFQANNPAVPFPGANIDVDLGLLSAAVNGTQAALADVRAGDGGLVNGIVDWDALEPLVVRPLMGGWTARGAWITATAYAAKDLISQGGLNYVCVAAHTAGVFATDLAAGRWLLIQSGIDAATANTLADARIAALALQLSGGTLTGNFTVSKATPVVTVNKAAPGQTADVVGSTAGVTRWTDRLGDATLEAGANAGSDYRLVRHADNGTVLGTALQIIRSTGMAFFELPPRVFGTDPTNINDLSRKAYVDAGDRWVTIADQVPTAVANIDVTWTAGAWKAIEVILTGILPATAGVTADLQMRVRRSGSFLAGATDYPSDNIRLVAGTVAGVSAANSSWPLGLGGTNAALDEVRGRLLLDPGGTLLEPGITGQMTYSADTPSGRATMVVSGAIATDGALDGLRLLWGSGANFAAQGRIVVMGLR
jgi:hypothetical protein